MMKTPLLLTAVACCACVVSPVAHALGRPVNVYVSGVSVSYPDPAGVDDLFNKNKNAAEVMLGFVAPKGCKFVSGRTGKLALRIAAASNGTPNSTVSFPVLRIPDHLPRILWGWNRAPCSL